jgi:hypothetical protein
MSERDAAGKLISIPGIVDAEATRPIQKPSGVPKLVAKGFKTGFLDIVELRIANIPIIQSVKSMLFFASFGSICEPSSWLLNVRCDRICAVLFCVRLAIHSF